MDIFKTNKSASNFLNSFGTQKKTLPVVKGGKQSVFDPTASYSSATSPIAPKPTAPTITTPQSTNTSLPPAGKQFADSLYQQNQTTNTQTNIQSPTTETGTPSPTPQTQPENPYQKYLKSLFTPEQTQSAFDKKNRDYQRLAEIQNRGDVASTEARRRYESILDKSGGLKGGAEMMANLDRRRSNQELADIALQESAAARTAGVSSDIYDQYINAGKSVYEAEQAQAKADREQANTDRTFKLAEDKFEEDKRQFGEQMALDRYKATAPKPLSAAQEAKQIADQEKEIAAQQAASQSLGIINNLLSGDKFKSITGVGQSPLSYIGLGAGVREFNQLKSQLALGARSLLKGSGAVSDYEAKVLQDSTSSLGRELDNDSFKQALLTVRGVIKTNNGQVTPVQVTNPATGETVEAELSGAEIYQLNSEGNVITYK
jgi:hypothetical protein